MGAVTSIPVGIDCGVTCSFAFVSGTGVALVATPNADSVFLGWSGGAMYRDGNVFVHGIEPRRASMPRSGANRTSMA